MLRLGMVLVGAALLLQSRKAQAEEEQKQGPEPEPDPEYTPPAPALKTTEPTIDEAIWTNPLLVSGSTGFTLPPTNWPAYVFQDPVTSGGINPGGMAPPSVGPGSPMTEAELHAAGAAYRTVVSNIIPGFTQMWLNTQSLASWQERALSRNASLAKRAVSFHKRVLKKIF